MGGSSKKGRQKTPKRSLSIDRASRNADGGNSMFDNSRSFMTQQQVNCLLIIQTHTHTHTHIYIYIYLYIYIFIYIYIYIHIYTHTYIYIYTYTYTYIHICIHIIIYNEITPAYLHNYLFAYLEAECQLWVLQSIFHSLVYTYLGFNH
jgi:hypothetical protein